MMNKVPFSSLTTQAVVLKGDRFRVNGRKPHHPLVKSSVRQLNQCEPETLSALRQVSRHSHLDSSGYEYEIWQESPSPRTIKLEKPIGESGEGSWKLRRQYPLTDDPCPFLTEDSQAWGKLLTLLDDHSSAKGFPFRSVRRLRWTGIHLELDGTTPQFGQPEESRRDHPDIITPWESSAWEPIHKWCLIPLEKQINSLSRTGDSNRKANR